MPAYYLFCCTLLLVVGLLATAGAREINQGTTIQLQAHAGLDATNANISKAPWFCHGIDCPRYKVVGHHESYEVREYEATKWVSTVIPGMALQEAMGQGFKRLFDYISGGNEAGSKVPMTAPVKNLISPGEGPFCSTNFTISFFVPFGFQEDTPEPTSKDLFFTYEGPVRKYVAQFAGRAQESKVLEESSALAEALLADGQSFDPEHYEYCGYDPPFRLLNRHNEVWFTAGSEKLKEA